MKTITQKEYIIYFFISLCFVAFNFATIKTLLPWCDEVMFLDTPINYVMYDSWSTTAWNKISDNVAFSIYPPLFQWVETIWMHIFGISIFSTRSLNFLIVFLIGLLILQFVKKYIYHNGSLGTMTVVVFSFLLWGTQEFGWMYRNARPDMLGMLFCLLTLRSIWNYLNSKSRFYLIQSCIFTNCALISGIQTAIFLIAVLLFVLLLYKDNRKYIIKVGIAVFLGFLLGMIICIAFFYHMGNLKPFIANIVMMSATLRSFFETVRPYIEGPLHLKPAAEREISNVDVETPGFFQRLLDSFNYLSYIVIVIINMSLLFIYRKNIKRPFVKDSALMLTVFSVFIILFMNLAGRFALYYRWMAFLPLLLSTLIILNSNQGNKLLKTGIYSIVTFILLMIGGYSFINYDGGISNSYNINMKDFQNMMNDANIPKDSHVAGPFFSYYVLKENYSHCYFPQIYPTTFINKLDYLIVYGETTHKKFELYGQASVINYLHELQSRDDVKLSLVHQDAKNDIKLYKVNILDRND